MGGALEGLRIIDFSWVLAGPALTRYLGDYGAEVIKVESETHPDIIRTSPPYRDGRQGLNRSGYWGNYNINKLGFSLNLEHPRGPEVARKLISRADAVVENYVPGTMEKWGLGYQDLLKVKPDIVMMSISLFGQYGPYKRRFGVGTFAEGMSGFLNLIGWPDRAPSYFQQVIGDALVPFLGVSALLAALEYRDRTGQGQWIDLNQLDTCSYMMAPLLLDYTINGREASRCGNRSPACCPHAVYPCLGRDRWCAISVSSDPEWRAFCGAMGDPPWSQDPRFATFANRKANEEELDRLIGAWTAQFKPDDLMHLLQSRGVATGAVLTGQGITEDPQLKHREATWYIDHPEIGRMGYYTAPFRLSGTPATSRMPPPHLGEHTEDICSRVLNMSTEEFTGLLNDGVFQ